VSTSAALAIFSGTRAIAEETAEKRRHLPVLHWKHRLFALLARQLRYSPSVKFSPPVSFTGEEIMSKFVRVAAVVVVAFSGLVMAGRSAQAVSFEHVDRLAIELQSQSSQLYREFRTHYSHAAHSQHLMSDAAALYRQARHLHDVAHTGNINHMARDLAEMDRLFHHLERLVREINFDAHDDHFGHGGHVHGDTRHVRRLMNDLEDTLHHLSDDINELRRNRPVYVPYNNRPRVSVVPGHGGGVTFGNGQFKFRVGF
jgi:hypothetical protein